MQRALLASRRLAAAGKTLNAAQLDMIATASSMASPLFARIVADELRLLGDFERLGARVQRYTSLPDTRALRRAGQRNCAFVVRLFCNCADTNLTLCAVVDRLVADFSAPPARPSLLSDLFACLLVVPQGLREAELVAASRCPPVTWSLLAVALDGTLVRRGEALALCDEDIVAVVRELCDAAALTRARYDERCC